MKLTICIIAFFLAVNAEYSAEPPKTLHKLSNVVPVAQRKNEVVVSAYYGLSAATVAVGLERLQALVVNNSPNRVIMEDMYSLFSGIDKTVDWNLGFQKTSNGASPKAYVYYLMDRNNTELLIASYKRCKK